MATKEELSEQLAVTQKLAVAVESMARAMARVESSYDTQIASVEKLTRAIEQLRGVDLSGLNQTKLSNVQKEFRQSTKEVTTLSGRLKDLGNNMTKKFPVAAAATTAALSGFVQGLRNVVAVGKVTSGFLYGLVDTMGSVSASIIAIPFKMFNALVDTAAAAGGGMNELAQAIENLRKEMGDLKGPGAKAVIDTSKTLKGFSDTGLSTFRVFGTLAERLELVTKVAVAMGATFGTLRHEFESNGGALLAFQKALGVSEEGMKAIGDRAITVGKPMTKVFMDMTKQTLALGKAFDIDQKLIGKDMTKALLDVRHFGALTVKEIGQASVYARKLGIELDKIVGTLDAFETFDSAAENAAKLSQAFGVNIDAFKLMEAQNPAEQLDMLRKSFRSAGVDASQFTRQQAKLLAQTTNLDEATVRQAFSAKNYGVSLQDVRKKSEAAEKHALTQAEAMSKLADSIERMVKSGGGQEGGFWQMFIKGILGGLQSTKEFREIIWSIKRSLQLVYFEGVKLGKMLPKLIPDMGEFLKGIKEFFDPAKFTRLFGGITKAVTEFLSGKMDFKGLMDRLQKEFFSFFDSESPSGKKMLDSFKKIFQKLAKVTGEGIKWASDQIANGLKTLTEFLRDPSAFLAKASAGGSGAMKFAIETLTPIAEALKHAWKVLYPAFKELMIVVWGKVKGFFASSEFHGSITPMLPYIAGALFGPSLLKALTVAAISSLGKSVFGMITSVFTGPAAEKGAESAAKGLGRIFGKSFGSFGKFMGPIGIALAIADVSVNIKNAMDKFQADLAPKFGETEAKVGAGAAGIINALTLGLLPKNFQAKIAETIANLANKLFKAIEDYFGEKFTKRIKDYVSSTLDIFSSIGQLIKDIFAGNESGIADSLVVVGQKIIDKIGAEIMLMIELIPTLAVQMLKFGYKFLGSIFHVLSKVFAKGDKIPVFGWLFKALSKILNFMGDVYESVSVALGKLAGLFKENGVLGTIGGVFTSIWNSIKAGWNAVVNFFKATIELLISPFVKTWNVIKETWTAAATWFDTNVVTPVVAVFKQVPTYIKEKFAGAWMSVKSVWTGVTTFFTDNVWSPIKKVFVGDGEGNGGIIGTIKGAFTGAWDAVKEVFSLKAINDLFGKVVTGIAKKLDELLKIPVFSEMIAVAKKVFDIKSPSRVFMKIGSQLSDGMSLGLAGLPTEVGKRMSEAAKVAAKGAAPIAAQVQKATPQDVNAAPGAAAVKGAAAVEKQMSELQQKAGSITANANAFANAVSKGGLAPALKAVEDMVKLVNQLNDTLNNLPKIDISAKLGSVAKSAGLGSKGSWTIKNKEVVLNIHLNVTMNVDEVEKVLILRKNSLVRDRINLALDSDKNLQPAKLPDNPNSPTQVPFAASKAE